MRAGQHSFLFKGRQVTADGRRRHLQPLTKVRGGDAALRSENLADLKTPFLSEHFAEHCTGRRAKLKPQMKINMQARAKKVDKRAKSEINSREAEFRNQPSTCRSRSNLRVCGLCLVRFLDQSEALCARHCSWLDCVSPRLRRRIRAQSLEPRGIRAALSWRAPKSRSRTWIGVRIS